MGMLPQLSLARTNLALLVASALTLGGMFRQWETHNAGLLRPSIGGLVLTMDNWFCLAMSGFIQAAQTICMLMVTQNGRKIRDTGNNRLGGQLTLCRGGSGNFGPIRQQKVHVRLIFFDQSFNEGVRKLQRSMMILLACLLILAAIVWAWQWKRGRTFKETSYPLPATGEVGVATPQKQFMFGEPVQK